MTQKEPHPHDQLFKQSLGKKEVMLDFLANRLPQAIFTQINQESLRLTNKTFAGKVRLRGESDVIFQATINNCPGYIYFICEHQSKIDDYMPLKFLEYNVRLMRQHISSEDGHTTLPVILNICVYNALETYDGPTNLLDMCANPDWVRKYMFQSFQLVDLNRESHEQILKDKKAAFAELLLRQGIHRKFSAWLKTHEQIFLNLLKEGNIPYLEETVYYILQVDTDEQIEARLATINPVWLCCINRLKNAFECFFL